MHSYSANSDTLPALMTLVRRGAFHPLAKRAGAPLRLPPSAAVYHAARAVASASRRGITAAGVSADAPDEEDKHVTMVGPLLLP